MTPAYSVRRLTDGQIADTYSSRMTRDFPADELKPLRRIREALSRGGYACFGLFDGASLLAYAFFVIAENEYLLDYFAVDEARRGSGIGSCFLTMLKPLLTNAGIVLIEVEHPGFAADADEHRMRERRRQFYLRSGCLDTGAEACVFGTEYRLLEMPLAGAHAQQVVKSAYLRIYQSLLPAEMMRRNIRLHE